MRFLLFCLAALVVAAPAAAGPRLIVGVTEDGMRFEPENVQRDAAPLGLDAVRVTLRWRTGQVSPTRVQRTELDQATSVKGLRVVLSVFGEKAVNAPRTAGARRQYCGFLRSVLADYSSIRDVVVWNEPNKTFFWQPQYDGRGSSASPSAYAALLATCWDVLHGARPNVNVLGPSTSPRGNDNPNAASNVSHSPVRFLQALGRAYKASGRTRPILDSFAHHVHGSVPGERPWRHRRDLGISQGDYGRLVETLQAAFAGTRQPVPGRCVGGRCAGIWYLEAGFQTTPDRAKARAYTGSGTADRGIPDAAGPVDLTPLPPADSKAPDQASQLVAAIRLAYCQPHVEAFFNFLLWDEARLEGWQSGLYWTDRTRKGSFAAFRDVVQDAKAGRISCGRVRAELPEPAAVLGGPGVVQARPPDATNPGATSGARPKPRATTATPTPRASTELTFTEAGGAPGAADDDGPLSWPLIAAGVAAFVLGAAGTALLTRRRARLRRISR